MTEEKPTRLNETSRGTFPALVALILMIAAGSIPAAPIFSQTVANPAVFDSATGSDRDAFSNGIQVADDLTIEASKTARSVTWWGILGPFNNTPVVPVPFDLIFYADSGGLPDPNNVISSTTVFFTALTDTGVNLNGKDIYVFQANLTPTALPGGTKVWFSVLANTSNDPDDNFLWRADEGGSSAYRSSLSAPFTASVNETPAFILDDAPVPVTP